MTPKANWNLMRKNHEMVRYKSRHGTESDIYHQQALLMMMNRVSLVTMIRSESSDYLATRTACWGTGIQASMISNNFWVE